jgi:hypothetical protein
MTKPLTNAPINSTVLSWAKAHVEPDVSFLDGLGIDPANVTVVNGAGVAWEKNGDGQWHEVPNAWHGVKAPGLFGRKTGTLKILAITPLHPKYGAMPQTWQSIQAMMDAYAGPVDWILSNNDNPLPEGFQNVTRQHNKAREIFLAGDYDALLSIEADMVVPPDAIDKLIEADADIAYGLYVWRHKPQRWNTYDEVDLFGGWSLSMYPDKAREAWGNVRDVAGLGMGCTLIRRHVLEHLNFRLYDGRGEDWILDVHGAEMAKHGIDPYRPRPGMFCDDWLLALEAQHFGFTQRAHFGVVCGHIDGQHVYWPDIDSDKLFRVESIEE